jgi:hypothetical protein
MDSVIVPYNNNRWTSSNIYWFKWLRSGNAGGPAKPTTALRCLRSREAIVTGLTAPAILLPLPLSTTGDRYEQKPDIEVVIPSLYTSDSLWYFPLTSSPHLRTSDRTSADDCLVAWGWNFVSPPPAAPYLFFPTCSYHSNRSREPILSCKPPHRLEIIPLFMCSELPRLRSLLLSSFPVIVSDQLDAAPISSTISTSNARSS